MIQDSAMEGSSSPNKTSLTNWWKQFKSKQSTRRDEDSLPSSGSSVANTSPYQGLESSSGGMDATVSEGSNLFNARPRLPYKSRSSSAIQLPRSASRDPEPVENTTNINYNNGNSEYNQDEFNNHSPIFGVPLARSIEYANVSISLSDPQGEQFIYGYIPIVVAKCGVYLKQNATSVEGIFRLSGSAKRIKDLQHIFNTPPRFGKGLDWAGFNVHDAANVLRRYLNNLPEPIIPLEFYEKFRDPLRDCTTIMTYLENKTAQQNPSFQQQTESDSNNESENDSNCEFEYGIPEDSPLGRDILRAVDRYQVLIANLPSLNRQLLMYILDLLAVFASRSEENLMPAPNLAAIFQPSILSHPTHDMSPSDYHLSRAVIEFMIEHSNKFLAAVEAIAIEEHEARKLEKEKEKSKKPSTNNNNNNNSQGKANDNNNENDNDKTAVNKDSNSTSTTNPELHSRKKHGRKHSKSLSSANIASNSTQQNNLPITNHAKIPNAYAPTSTSSTPTGPPQQESTLINPKNRTRPNENKIPRVPVEQPATLGVNNNNNSTSGSIMSTLRRASSLSRRSSVRKPSKADSLERSNTVSINSNPNLADPVLLVAPGSNAHGASAISITITNASENNHSQPEPSQQQQQQQQRQQQQQQRQQQQQNQESQHSSRQSLSLNNESNEHKRNSLSNLLSRMQSPVRKQKQENYYTDSNIKNNPTLPHSGHSPQLYSTRSPTIFDNQNGGLSPNIKPLSPEGDSDYEDYSNLDADIANDRNARSLHRNADYNNGHINTNSSPRPSSVSKWRKSIIAITGHSSAPTTDHSVLGYNDDTAVQGGDDNALTISTSTSTSTSTLNSNTTNRGNWFQRMRSRERKNLTDGQDQISSNGDDSSSFTFEHSPSGRLSPNMNNEK